MTWYIEALNEQGDAMLRVMAVDMGKKSNVGRLVLCPGSPAKLRVELRRPFAGVLKNPQALRAFLFELCRQQGGNIDDVRIEEV